tara:strand:- start:178 stop:699 length:522 start_codon:yes stop_codon:yes gene_type:complete
MKAAMEDMKYIPDPVPPRSFVTKKDPERQFPGPQCEVNGRTIADIYPNIKFKNKTVEKGCKGRSKWNGLAYDCTDPKIKFSYNKCTPGKTASCSLNAECLGEEGYECTTKDLCCRKDFNEELDCDLSKKLFRYTTGITQAEWEKKKCTPYDTEYCARNPPCEKKSRWQSGKCD